MEGRRWFSLRLFAVVLLKNKVGALHNVKTNLRVRVLIKVEEREGVLVLVSVYNDSSLKLLNKHVENEELELVTRTVFSRR